ncbi:High frequency lysogenization protein HflD [Candidatus Ecksteinia adelgidicola]|nr:High frequency lysogenization protein HflD [Candidatus Ecksteinia adelgidicola]
MTKNYYDIILSMAGISQSAQLVQQLAYKGKCDQKALHISLNSLLKIDSSSTLSVFGKKESTLQLGIEALINLLSINNKSINTEITRYTFSLIMLERKFYANKQAIKTLTQRLYQLKRQLIYFSIESNTIINALASIYTDVISSLGPRIYINGSEKILQNLQIQATIRAVLLAGIRSAVLWQQVGGSRFQLMFFRRRLLKEAKKLFLITNSI